MELLPLLLLAVAVGIVILLRWRGSAATLRDERPRVPCDRCAELILPEAKVCRYCGAERTIIRARQ
jgi:rRNA maturation endonuclease Nob1